MTREEAIAELSVLHERLSNPKDCEDGCYSWEDGWYVEAIDMAIEALSERPKGEWQKVDEQPYFRKHFDNVCCSVCHHKGMRKYNFCPNCGADMRGEEE